jgi:thiamine biosynthesis lipoprotein
MNVFESREIVFGNSCRIMVGGGDIAGDEGLDVARSELKRLEEKFCCFQPGSIISSINQCAGTGAYTPLDPEAQSLFQYIDVLWRESNHLFDPTTRLLQNCYGEDGEPMASVSQLKDMTRLVGWQKLEIDQRGAHLSDKGMLIDLNSCVRPYAIDSVRKRLARHGVEHALIEMDHDITTLGRQPDGSNWLVGIRHPTGSRTAISRIKLNQKGYALRGDFERRVTLAGEYFGRALSPIDGQPIPGLLGVAVVAENCLTACSAATIARLKTEQAGLKWLAQLGEPWLAIDRQLNCHGPLAPQ